MLTHGFKRCIAMAVRLQCFWSFRDSKYHRRKYTRAKLFTSCCLESERGEERKKKIEKGKEEWGRVARRVRVQEQPETGEMGGTTSIHRQAMSSKVLPYDLFHPLRLYPLLFPPLLNTQFNCDYIDSPIHHWGQLLPKVSPINIADIFDKVFNTIASGNVL